MLIHKGSIYRFALTLKQKEQKKDYLLKQQLSKGEPSFEEVLEFAKTYEGNSEYRAKLQEIEEEAEQLVLEKYEAEHKVDAYGEFYNEHVEEIERLAEELAVKEMEENYNIILNSHWLQGKPCYRAIALKEGVDPTTLSGLGIYWSQESYGANLYDAPSNTSHNYRATFKAEIDIDCVDAKTMIINNFIYPNEKEVTFIKHCPIFVEGVWVTSRENTSIIGIDEYLTPIEDWRRC